MMSPRLLLRVEGAVLCGLAVCAYGITEGNWLLFAVLLFAPDLAMLGYSLNQRAGALVYNAIHTITLPALLGAAGYLSGSALMLHVAFIWIAHIGFDRVLGYGLKYPTGFKDTHLNPVRHAA
jgi:hypothetical protein